MSSPLSNALVCPQILRGSFCRVADTDPSFLERSESRLGFSSEAADHMQEREKKRKGIFCTALCKLRYNDESERSSRIPSSICRHSDIPDTAAACLHSLSYCLMALLGQFFSLSSLSDTMRLRTILPSVLSESRACWVLVSAMSKRTSGR